MHERDKTRVLTEIIETRLFIEEANAVVVCDIRLFKPHQGVFPVVQSGKSESDFVGVRSRILLDERIVQGFFEKPR